MTEDEYMDAMTAAARAIWDHDHRDYSGEFPTGDPSIDDPYYCRADDALQAVGFRYLVVNIAAD